MGGDPEEDEKEVKTNEETIERAVGVGDEPAEKEGRNEKHDESNDVDVGAVHVAASLLLFLLVLLGGE